MSEIDVTYCKFARLNDVCASPINTQECKCSKIPIQMCYYKQLQQAKEENEELRSDNSMLLAKGDANAFVISNLNFKIQKLQQCLDEIEGILSKRC